MLKIEQWSIVEAVPAPPRTGALAIWLLDLDAIEADLSPLLCADEQSRRQSMVRETDRRLFTNARGCLRFILSAYLGLPAESIQFSYSAKGKPQLAAIPTPLHFNLSHSGAMALLAVSTDAPVGIDLERELVRDNLRKIARKVFGPEWINAIEPIDDLRFRRAFFKQWTQHEARVKAIGEGVFSHVSRRRTIPCVNFSPREGWCAAVAVDGGLPSLENWGTYRFTPELLAGIG
ncbi:4'-phosphopantetheinyl transferase family protein [Sedimenticola hydrogenitrophicus]|uniref:4'-phosphopantetheinyl transferase family protein n=1 Tax=Sedimenticola hydrogenitrophicus TaxID=2967975 RepID=UPI0021A77776|nr:4'-phosphopantetheinyl transferase superfamily protein [Sedimenticola hydrogenitrophicus]